MSYGYYHTSNISLYCRKKFAFDSDGKLIYKGYAAPGSKPDEPKWHIEKFIYDTEDNLIDIVQANGEIKFDKVWDDKESYDYF